ncbi:hypothetical protein K491DRAFT_719286 [Lophiostoma macrostomum CBS 122681]|uniref:Bacteriocin-protection protein, YdeI/OmpD-associated family n=1 Tax=Lophiostoma macrostomum CBS 122681 TaxID=1314788 RepID=A0A6A6T0F6_9PLEO|nr:hypothetical protein K491DRAFT_719286 [Lophiostoma macrostomum CBS 122681]
MPPKALLPTDLPIVPFASMADFEAYLEREHVKAPGVYLKLAKKGSGIPSVASTEAVEVALCFGWIDGRAQTIDDTWWLSRYTPRRQKSIWSQKNVNTIARLTEQGRMRPAGISAVDAAKRDGRWDRAYAGPATITIPDDMDASLTSQPTARAFFDGLNKSDRYAVLWRVETASPKVRAQRIESLVAMLAVGKLPGYSGSKKAEKTTRTKPTIAPRTKLLREIATASTPKMAFQDQRPRREGLRRRAE